MDLSVQVHPDDAYAHRHENGELGKTECWYVLDCKKDAELILGHRAQTREDFVRLIEQNEWDHLLRRIPIKPGDFSMSRAAHCTLYVKVRSFLKSSKALMPPTGFTTMTGRMGTGINASFIFRKQLT